MGSMKLNKNIKRIKILSLIAIAATFSLTFVNANAAGDAKVGEELSQTCLGCHGAPGLRNPGPVYSIPMLGGQNAEYLVIALKAYKDKTRSHSTMQAQAASLTEQNMEDIAAYFSQSKNDSRPSLVNKELAAIGKKAAGTCVACHGADGASTTADSFPILAGQYESYLLHALKGYRSGERQNAIMNGFMKELGIKDLKALAAWFASQESEKGVNAPKTKIFKFK